MKNIVLIGFMGSGKTSMGRFLSRELDYEFFDTDKELENVTGLKVNQIVKKYGKKEASVFMARILYPSNIFDELEENINSSLGFLSKKK